MPRPKSSCPWLPRGAMGVTATTPHQDLRPPPPACSSSVCGGAGRLRPVCCSLPQGADPFQGTGEGWGMLEPTGRPQVLHPGSQWLSLSSPESPHPLWGAISWVFAQTWPSLPRKPSTARQRVGARALAVMTGVCVWGGGRGQGDCDGLCTQRPLL